MMNSAFNTNDDFLLQQFPGVKEERHYCRDGVY